MTETTWWYLSFRDDARGFLGAAYVDGDSFTEAWVRTHVLGINPGGEVAFYEVAPDVIDAIPESDRLRLLSREEVSA